MMHEADGGKLESIRLIEIIGFRYLPILEK